MNVSEKNFRTEISPTHLVKMNTKRIHHYHKRDRGQAGTGRKLWGCIDGTEKFHQVFFPRQRLIPARGSVENFIHQASGGLQFWKGPTQHHPGLHVRDQKAASLTRVQMRTDSL